MAIVNQGVSMRKVNLGLDDVKKKISALKGRNVEMNINRGRKKIDTINGTIKDVYPSVFTVKLDDEQQKIQTFSYFDVLCGNVIIL